MRVSEAKAGRIFVIRLEDGEIVHESIERFAKEKEIQAATLIILGGADAGSRLVVGPEGDGRSTPVQPVTHILSGVHEVTGTGTLFPNDSDEPVLHLHIACGRGEEARAGCIRSGVKVWHVMEVVLYELLDTTAIRKKDPVTGFELLAP